MGTAWRRALARRTGRRTCPWVSWTAPRRPRKVRRTCPSEGVDLAEGAKNLERLRLLGAGRLRVGDCLACQLRPRVLTFYCGRRGRHAPALLEHAPGRAGELELIAHLLASRR